MSDKVTLNKNGKPRAVGSGRTKGSNSFMMVPLKDLVGKFADMNQQIPIYAKFGKSLFNAPVRPASAAQGIIPTEEPILKTVDLNAED